MSPYVLGIDGCRSGWLICSLELETRKLGFRIFQSFAEILTSHESAKFIGIDIPIGLRHDARPRHCDVEARRLLAPKRSVCVFSAPPRRLLNAPNYREACMRSLQWFGGKVSQQSFAIYPKVSEVDRLMNPKIQERVFEVHPEVCFWRINGGQALPTSKKSREGYEERRRLLNATCGIALPDSWNWLSVMPHRPVGANRDDLLDAAVAAHVARRKVKGDAKVLPEFPEVDDRGIRMEMIF
jgi:predicted RNase H-like nuclease